MGDSGGSGAIFLSRYVHASAARPPNCDSAELSLDMPSTVMAISAHGAHIFGSIAVGVAVVFVWFYFYLGRLITRDIDKPRWR